MSDDNIVKPLIVKIINQTQLTWDQVNEMINKEIKNLSGLIDREGAIVIVAKNLGIDITKEPFNSNSPRPTWKQYFLEIAKVVSTRSTCFRSQCGAIIVKDKAIISTGYNGASKNQKNCQEIGYCYRQDHKIPSGTQTELCRAVGSHAESNAIVLAAMNGNAVKNSTIYIYGNTYICNQCRAMIANAEIDEVIHLTKEGKTETYIPRYEWTIHEIDNDDED